MRNLTFLLSDNLQKCWLCRHTFMANSPLVATGLATLGVNISFRVIFLRFLFLLDVNGAIIQILQYICALNVTVSMRAMCACPYPRQVQRVSDTQ
jgi:hypothetical protein